VSAVEREHPPDWDAYRAVPIVFEVIRVLKVRPDPAAETGLAIVEAPVRPSWTKDYDALGGGISRWSHFYSPERWGVYVARISGERVGGAVVSLEPLLTAEAVQDRESSHAFLWDLRVAPSRRGAGIGRALFHAAISWARDTGCDTLLIETQNINVAACRFYERQGCTIVHVDAHAYTDMPDEVQLVWRKDLRD